MFSSSFTGAYSDVSSHSLSKMQRPNISYDTSSKDPQMLRSRIFVGGLNTNTVTRDDVIQLFSSYGTILGVTLFKGYAFVQYSNMNEADLAVSALNLYHWHGSALDTSSYTFIDRENFVLQPLKTLWDVKIVAKDQKIGGLPSTVGVNGTIGKRPAQSDQSNEAKKGRSQTDSSFDISGETRNGLWNTYVYYKKDSKQAIRHIMEMQLPDLFICGVCRFATPFFETFIIHRKVSCNIKIGKKFEGEPENFECCSCSNNFITCWELIEHLSKCHNLAVYRDALIAPEKRNVKNEN